MQILNICHHIYFAAWLQGVSVIGQKCRVDDPSTMVRFLEVGVRKTEKYFLNLNDVFNISFKGLTESFWK
jgi:hypothetical protein